MTAPTPDLPKMTPRGFRRISDGEYLHDTFFMGAVSPSIATTLVSLEDAHAAILADRAAGRALEAVPQWIPVGDRKPAKYGQYVLVLTTNADDEPHAVTACWNGDKLFLGTGGRRIDPVTHWMAIPSLAASPAASPVPAEVVRESDQQLMRFYSVETLAALIDAQERHIVKLQAKLPPPRDESPRNPRIG